MRQRDTINPRHVATVHAIIEGWACDGKQIQDMRLLRDAMEDALQAESSRSAPPDAGRALREALEEIANDGCGVRKPGQLPCLKSYADRSDWCWSCVAQDALNKAGPSPSPDAALRAARDEAIEEAAKVCDRIVELRNRTPLGLGGDRVTNAVENVAHMIRAIKSRPAERAEP